MLTREKIKDGEGKLKYFNLEIGRATKIKKMEDNDMHTKNE